VSRHRQNLAQKDLLREAMGKTLKELIPIVESGMHDLKSEVSKQSFWRVWAEGFSIVLIKRGMRGATSSLDRRVVRAVMVSQTTFVAIVTSPVLAMLTPLLARSLNTPATPQEMATKVVWDKA
jgi:elongation factor 3